jgi:hypothetical protein
MRSGRFILCPPVDTIFNPDVILSMHRVSFSSNGGSFAVLRMTAGC